MWYTLDVVFVVRATNVFGYVRLDVRGGEVVLGWPIVPPECGLVVFSGSHSGEGSAFRREFFDFFGNFLRGVIVI